MDLLLDLRSAWRQLRKGPMFSVTAVFTLALGIGATTIAFAIARGVLWRPLPFSESDRLVAVWETEARLGFSNRNEASFADFLDWRDADAGFDHLTALANRTLNLTGAGDPERLLAVVVSVDFFDALGVAPAIGRGFTNDEEHPSAAPTAILSHGLWVRRFGGNQQIVGRAIMLSGVATTVVGVLPPDFRFEFPRRRDIDIWIPRVVSPQAHHARRGRGLYVVGRLRPHTTIASAQAKLSAVMSRVAAEFPNTNAGWDVRLVPLQDQIAGSARTPLTVLLAAGVCLLLIVCANLGTLLLARAATRQGEMAVRTAIGATSGRLLRQHLTENAVLALAGALLGILLAHWGLSAIRQDVLGINLPRLHELQLDGVTWLFALGMTAVSAIALGAVPASLSIRQVQSGDLNADLRRAAARQGTLATTRQTTMAAAEMMMAVMLLIAAGLLFKSLSRLQRVDPGFEARGVLTFQLSVPYSQPRQIGTFYDELMMRLSALPGVVVAGAVTNLPLGGSNQTNEFSIEGQPKQSARLPEADFRATTPGYFRAMSLRLVGGRLFDDRDVASAPRVAILNEAMAQRYWPGGDALSRRIKFGHDTESLPWTTIVGITGNVRHTALQSAPVPEVYVPQAQVPNDFMYVVVKSDTSAAAETGLVRAVADQVHAMDKGLPIFKVAPLTEIVDAAIAEPRLNARLIGAFGLIALILAVGGTYGVASYTASRRTREIGVRLALGADRRDVMRLVLARGANATIVGAGIGTAGALVLMRLLESMLFGVTSHDAATFIAAPLTLLMVSLVACSVPAWRATKMNPVTVLRSE